MSIYYDNNHQKGKIAEEYIKKILKNKDNHVIIFPKENDMNGKDIEEYNKWTRLYTTYQVKSTTTDEIKLNVNNCIINYIAIVKLIQKDNSFCVDEDNVYIIPIGKFGKICKIYKTYNKRTGENDLRYCLNIKHKKIKLLEFKK